MTSDGQPTPLLPEEPHKRGLPDGVQGIGVSDGVRTRGLQDHNLAL
jgi:hypothetical protein